MNIAAGRVFLLAFVGLIGTPYLYLKNRKLRKEIEEVKERFYNYDKKRKAESNTKAEPVSEFLEDETYSTSSSYLASVPTIAKKTKHKIKSYTDPSKTYTVNLKTMTCTCPNWKYDRRDYAMDDPRRVYKHIASVLPRESGMDKVLIDAQIYGEWVRY